VTATAGDPVLETREVHKSFGNADAPVVALAGLSLTVLRGRFLSVMGPSGSGKSTLLHLLGALDRPTTGDVLVEGQSLTALSEREIAHLRRDRIGFVFQAYNLIPVLTAAENVALPAVIARRRGAEQDARVDAVLEQVGLGDVRNRLPSQLSGGQQQRVALARALFTNPAVVLADEPTGNLDSRAGAEVLELLRSAQREVGATVVMVTHDASAAATGDEVMLLRDGRHVSSLDLDGTPAAGRAAAVLRWLEAAEGTSAPEVR
jgi:putative ABC transport system ATP-binding protein